MGAAWVFLNSPLGKFLAKLFGGIALAIGLFFAAQHYTHKFLDGVRDDVREEYVVRDLKAAVVQAEKDRKFSDEQAKKSEQAAQELRDSLSVAVGKIKNTSTVIHDRVATGELQNGKAGPVVIETVDRIEQLEADRKAQK